MQKYLSDSKLRKTAQTAITAVQLALMILAIIFMTLFVSTPAPSEKDFSITAIIFAIIWGIFYVAQLVFAVTTYAKTSEKNKVDKIFLITSAVWIVVGAGIYGIITLCL